MSTRTQALTRASLIALLVAGFVGVAWRVVVRPDHPLDALNEFVVALHEGDDEAALRTMSRDVRERLDLQAFRNASAQFSVLSRAEGVAVHLRASDRIRAPATPYIACAQLLVPGGVVEAAVVLVDESGWKLQAMRIDGRPFAETDAPASACRRSRLR